MIPVNRHRIWQLLADAADTPIAACHMSRVDT